MNLIPAVGTACTLAMGLLFLSTSPVQAQQTNTKTKTKITNATGIVAKTKVQVAAAPQPTTPLASEPQVVVANLETEPVPATAATADIPAGWLTDLAAAKAAAKASNRPILAVFSGSDWCKPCIMYQQEVFAKPEFMAYAKDKLVLAHFDFPRQKRNQPTAAQLKLNETAAAQLNREGDFPLAVLIAPDGKVLAKTGYIAGGPVAFEAYLKKVMPTL